MLDLIYVNWSNGAIIMTVVFGLVIVGLVYAVISMMNSGKKKDDESHEINWPFDDQIDVIDPSFCDVVHPYNQDE